ncbi:hypothetical protein GGU11DRAFT_761416, partial [Lentinula aff. detonsa]
MQGPLETFSELSAREAQKQKERAAEEHSAFWADKKEHGLEHIRDRLQRFSDECQDIPGSVEVYSEEEMEEMEQFLEDFDLSFLNSHAYYNEASHGKGKKNEDSIVPSSPPSSNLPDELDAEVDRILQDGNFTCNFELYQLRSRDLHTLNPTSWLNDSVIDAYVSLISSTTPPDITIVHTFVYAAIWSARSSGRRMRENDVLFRLTKPVGVYLSPVDSPLLQQDNEIVLFNTTEPLSHVFKVSSVNVEKQHIPTSTSSTPVPSGYNEKHPSTNLEPSHSVAPLDLQLDLDQEIDELLLREVEDINLDPDADLKLDPYAKEDLEPQSEPLGHVTSQGLNIASV